MQAENGASPLHVCAQRVGYGDERLCVSMVQTLLRLGVDPTLKLSANGEHFTAHELARLHDHYPDGWITLVVHLLEMDMAIILTLLSVLDVPRLAIIRPTKECFISHLPKELIRRLITSAGYKKLV